jgi:hypothetical protein
MQQTTDGAGTHGDDEMLRDIRKHEVEMQRGRGMGGTKGKISFSVLSVFRKKGESRPFEVTFHVCVPPPLPITYDHVFESSSPKEGAVGE